MDKNGYSSIVYSSPKLETTQMTTNSWIDMYLTHMQEAIIQQWAKMNYNYMQQYE